MVGTRSFGLRAEVFFFFSSFRAFGSIDGGLEATPTWDCSDMEDEPRRHPRYLLMVAICSLGSVPFLFVEQESLDFLGFPLWLWSSLFFTACLSAVTAWGIRRFWKDGGSD